MNRYGEKAIQINYSRILWQKVLLSEVNALIFLFIFSAAAFLSFLGARPLWAPDEIRVAGIGANMLLAKSWAVPLLNGHPFLEKPPLYFWSEAAAFNFFGFTPFAARLPSAVSAIAGTTGIYLLSKSFGFSRSASLLSAMMLTLSVQYFITGRRCIMDLMLTAFILWTIYCGYNLLKNDGKRQELLQTLLFSFFLSAGLLTKGLVALAIPLVVLLPWYAVTRGPGLNLIMNRKIGFFLAAILIAFVFFGIWLFFLYEKAGAEAVYELVWRNNFGRFSGTHAAHAEPFLYYFRKLPEQALPWAVLIPFAIGWHLQRVIVRRESSSVFLICWLTFPFLMLCAASGKRPIYLLPLHPAAVLAIGIFVDAWIMQRVRWFSDRIVLKYFLMALAFIETAATLLFIYFIYSGGKTAGPSGLLVCITIIPAAMSLAYLKKERFRDSLQLIMCGLMILFIAWDSSGSALKWSDNSLRPFYMHISTFNKKIILYRPGEALKGGAVFYLNRVIPEAYSEDDLIDMTQTERLEKDDEREVIIIGKKEELTKIKHFNIFAEYRVKSKIMAAAVWKF